MTSLELRPNDYVLPFQIEGSGLRGRMVRLDDVLAAILGQHAYPRPVAMLLAEALALTAILASGLKFQGTFSLQAKGDGPVPLLVVDYWTPGVMRGYARFDAAGVDAAQPAGAPVPKLLGAGLLAFTVDQGESTERYQGIVELAGATLSDCAHRYFQQSEQLETGIRLAAQVSSIAGGEPRWLAGAVMLQRLPLTSEGLFPGLASRAKPPSADEAWSDRAAESDPEESWRAALALLGSARDEELTNPHLKPHDLLFRLFHEHGVRVWPEHPLRQGCSCAPERAERVLRSFSASERAEMAVDGQIFVTCEFCNSRYAFSSAQLDAASPAAGD